MTIKTLLFNQYYFTEDVTVRRKLCSETPLATREGTSDSSVRNTVWFFQSCHGAANLMFSLPSLHWLASTCIQDKHFIYFIMLLLDVYVLIKNVYINILSLPRAFFVVLTARCLYVRFARYTGGVGQRSNCRSFWYLKRYYYICTGVMHMWLKPKRSYLVGIKASTYIFNYIYI